MSGLPCLCSGICIQPVIVETAECVCKATTLVHRAEVVVVSCEYLMSTVAYARQRVECVASRVRLSVVCTTAFSIVGQVPYMYAVVVGM